MACATAWFQRDEHVLRLDIFMDQAALMDVAEGQCDVDRKPQKECHVEGLLLVPAQNAIQGLAAWVLEYKDRSPLVAGECDRLGGPSRIEIVCERVFVL
jgi:hypothetical protein